MNFYESLPGGRKFFLSSSSPLYYFSWECVQYFFFMRTWTDVAKIWFFFAKKKHFHLQKMRLQFLVYERILSIIIDFFSFTNFPSKLIEFKKVKNVITKTKIDSKIRGCLSNNIVRSDIFCFYLFIFTVHDTFRMLRLRTYSHTTIFSNAIVT